MSPVRRVRPTSRPSPSARNTPSPLLRPTSSATAPLFTKEPITPRARPSKAVAIHPHYLHPSSFALSPQQSAPAWHHLKSAEQFSYDSPPPWKHEVDYAASPLTGDSMPDTPGLSVTSLSSLADDNVSSPVPTEQPPLQFIPPPHFCKDEHVGYPRAESSNITPHAAHEAYEDAPEYPFPRQIESHTPTRAPQNMEDPWALSTPSGHREHGQRLPHVSMLQGISQTPSSLYCAGRSAGHSGQADISPDNVLCSPMQLSNSSGRSQSGQSRALSARLNYSSTRFVPPHSTPYSNVRDDKSDSPQSFYTPSSSVVSCRSNLSPHDSVTDLFSPGYSMHPLTRQPSHDLGAAMLSRTTSHRSPSHCSPFHTPFPDDHASPADTDIVTPATIMATEGACSLDMSKLPRRFLERFRLTDELGTGGYGFVCAASMQIGDDPRQTMEVAVKFIYKNKMGWRDFAQSSDIPNEAYVLSMIDHPSIVKFVELYETDTHFILVQELHGDPWGVAQTLKMTPEPSMTEPIQPIKGLFDPGDMSGRPRMGRRASYDLFEAVETKAFSEVEARHIFTQVASGVQYLHERGVYHRDLKDENIVMDHDHKIKIIDFGSAVVENPVGPPLYYDSFHGTKSYASPEIITERYYRAGPADMWSLGIILHILLTGEQPFDSTEMVLRGCMRQPRAYSSAAADLLDGMLHNDPDYRFDIHDVMQHPWTRGVGQLHIPRYSSFGHGQQAPPPGAMPQSRPMQQSSIHQSTDSAGSMDSIGSAQAQMMDAVAIPMYDTGTGLLGFVTGTGTASMSWAQEHCYAQH